MESTPRALVLAGLVLVGLGLLLHLGPGLPPLGRLPGDVRLERAGLRIYLPITSCLLVSGVLTGVFWLASRWRG